VAYGICILVIFANLLGLLEQTRDFTDLLAPQGFSAPTLKVPFAALSFSKEIKEFQKLFFGSHLYVSYEDLGTYNIV